MKQLVRWPGLAIFAATTTLLVTFYLLWLDSLIRYGAIRSLEQATGAQVDIQTVTHTLSPLVVTFNMLELTDPANPAQNQIAATKVQASIAFTPLLMRKLIIDDLNAVGVSFNQLRDSPGEVYRAPEGDDSDLLDDFMPELKQVNIDELLAQSELQTSKAIRQAQASYEQHYNNLNQQFANLPDKERIDFYRQKIDSLRATDLKNPAAIANAKSEFEQLREAMQQDKNKLTEFKRALNEANNDANNSLKALRQAPEQDYNLLSGVVSGDQQALQQATEMVFGEQAAQFSNYLLAAYQLVAPMLSANQQQQQQLQQQEGEWIGFGDTTGLPDLLIRRANIELEWQQQPISSQWQNITYQHDIIGTPTRFQANAGEGLRWQGLALQGDFQFAESGLTANQQWQIDGLKLQDLTLIDSQQFSSMMQQGVLTSSGQLQVQNNQFDGMADFALSSLSLAASGSDKFTDTLADLLQNISALSITSGLTGALSNPSLSLQSDLDKQLASALLTGLTNDQQGQLAELRQKLEQRVATQLGENQQYLQQLADWQGFAQGESDSLDGMLQTGFDSLLEQQKDKLLKKLGSKLFGG